MNDDRLAALRKRRQAYLESIAEAAEQIKQIGADWGSGAGKECPHSSHRCTNLYIIVQMSLK